MGDCVTCNFTVCAFTHPHMLAFREVAQFLRVCDLLYIGGGSIPNIDTYIDDAGFVPI